MNITSYTSYAEIRQVVGLSVKELPDTELAVELYNNVLQLKLQEVVLPSATPGPGPLDARFLVIAALAENARTTAEQKLYNLTRLYSTYVVAYEVSMSLSTRTPKTIADGKHTLVRFSPESVYQDTAKNISKQVEDLRQKIEAISDDTTVLIMPLMTAIKPAYNVVTDE